MNVPPRAQELSLEILHVQAVAPRYRAVLWDGDWEKLHKRFPLLRYPYSHPSFPGSGYLLLDPELNVVLGWTSSLQGFSVNK